MTLKNIARQCAALLAAGCLAAGATAQTDADAARRAAEGAKTVALLQELIRLDSSNAPGDTTRIAAHLKALFEPLGAQIEIVLAPNGRAAHFFARHKGDGSKRPLLLAAHTDVVPADKDKWVVDPFGGVEKDGYVWGRGALDNKGSVAVFARAVLRILEEKQPLARDIIFLAEADEEPGAFNTTWLAKQHWDKMDAEFALNEGGFIFTDEQGTARQFNVGVIDKVSINIKLRSSGPVRHSSVPPPALETANGRLLAALARLSAYSGPIRVMPETEAYLRSQAKLNPGPLSTALDQILASNDAAVREAALRALHIQRPEEAPVLNALLRNTLTVTMFSAGVKANVIPGEAEATLNARLLPGTPIESLLQDLRERIGDPEVQLELISSLPKAEQPMFFKRRPMIPPSSIDTELFSAMQRQAKQLWPQVDVVPTMMIGGTDATPWRDRGVPVYGIYPYPIRPELFLTFHGHNERVPVESLHQGTEFVYRLLLDVAGKR